MAKEGDKCESCGGEWGYRAGYGGENKTLSCHHKTGCTVVEAARQNPHRICEPSKPQKHEYT
jgi:hypothetical protein